MEVTEGNENIAHSSWKKISLLTFFSERRTEEMIDLIRYNTVIDLYIDNILNLTQDVVHKIKLSGPIAYNERVSLFNSNLSNKRIISNISWHPNSKDIVAICYVEKIDKEVEDSEITLLSERQIKNNAGNRADNDNKNKIDDVYINKNVYDLNKDNNYKDDNVNNKDNNTKVNQNIDSGVLIWSLSDHLYPKMMLVNDETTQVVSFCPFKPEILIGGSSSGRIIVWDLQCLFDFDQTSGKIPIINPIAVLDSKLSYSLAIRNIQWLPSHNELRSNGNFQKSSERSFQFLTVSDGGLAAIWDLRWQANLRSFLKFRTTNILKSSDSTKLDGVLQPVYQIAIQRSKESRTFSPVSCCVPLIDDKNQGVTESNTRTNEMLNRFLVATLKGEIIIYSWKDQDLGTQPNNLERCDFLSYSCIYDGPVLEVLR